MCSVTRMDILKYCEMYSSLLWQQLAHEFRAMACVSCVCGWFSCSHNKLKKISTQILFYAFFHATICYLNLSSCPPYFVCVVGIVVVISWLMSCFHDDYF